MSIKLWTGNQPKLKIRKPRKFESCTRLQIQSHLYNCCLQNLGKHSHKRWKIYVMERIKLIKHRIHLQWQNRGESREDEIKQNFLAHNTKSTEKERDALVTRNNYNNLIILPVVKGDPNVALNTIGYKQKYRKEWTSQVLRWPRQAP